MANTGNPPSYGFCGQNPGSQGTWWTDLADDGMVLNDVTGKPGGISDLQIVAQVVNGSGAVTESGAIAHAYR